MVKHNLRMDIILDDIMIEIIRFKDYCKKKNISEDDMETLLLETLESVGINFTR